jgi:hypothetical protein
MWSTGPAFASAFSNRFFFGIYTFEGGDGRGANGTLAFLPEFLKEVLQ